MVKQYLRNSVTVLTELDSVLNNFFLCFVYDNSISDVLTTNCLLHERNLMLENDVTDRKIFECGPTGDFMEKICFKNITESFWSLDSLKEQRSLTLSKVAIHVRLADAVVYSGKCGNSP